MAVYPDIDALEQLADHLRLRCGDQVLDATVAFGELTVTSTLSSIVDLIEFLRSDSSCRFSTLIDITAVDHPERVQRFDMVWHLLSMYQNQRIRVKVAIREDEVVPSMYSRIRSKTDQVAKHLSASSALAPEASRSAAIFSMLGRSSALSIT